MLRRVLLGCTCAVVLALIGPSSVAWADFTVTEGQSFSGKVVDTGPCGATNITIDWGDGTTSAGTSDGGTGVNGTHTYADEGTFNGKATYFCTQFGSQQMMSFKATVVDAPLSGAGRDISGNAGQSLTSVVAHFNDASPTGKASDFTAQIAWGDGSTSGGSVTSAAGGGFDVTGTHTYGAAGNFTVSTAVTDIGGSSTTTQSTARIGAAIPSPPRSTGAPLVSGEPRDHEPLTTTDGNWSGSPSAYEYQWLRCATPTGDNCVVVPGATASSYTAVRDDVGSTIRSRVRGRNADGLSLPADSAPTAVVQPFVVRARFTISRNPTCTGVPVTFDGSISKTPNGPIKRYRFTETIFSVFKNYVPPGPWPLGDGPNPRVTATFGYDLNLFAVIPVLAYKKIYLANPRRITLTVTDLAGDSASYSQDVEFNPALSDMPRTNCPQSRRRPAHFVKHSVAFNATKTSASARIPCATTADCAATLLLRTTRHGGKRVLLAKSATVYVPGHQTATITAKLTRQGRSLIARGKPIAAIALFTIVDATGQTASQSVKATLRKKKARP